jgi:multidrug resistance efflux pump
MKVNWYYIFILLMFAAMMALSLSYFKGSKYSTVGITHSREHKINAEKAALVKAVQVRSGQQVKAGDLLVELTSNELEIEIAKLVNQIEALKSEQIEKAKLAESEIAYIRADDGIRLEEINTDIAQAESELDLNQKLTRNFLTSSDSGNVEPLKLKLNSLKKQKARQEDAIAIRVKDILQQRDTEQNLLRNKIQLLEKELALLTNERKTLNKYATGEVLVEIVYVRPGEQVDAFTALLSLNLLHPATVVGYIVGTKETLPVGSEVDIQSYDHPALHAAGKVIGYGAVVGLPEILQKSTAVKAFGREVFIEIGPANGFATGEKVLIR